MIYEIKTFVDSAGRHISVRIPTEIGAASEYFADGVFTFHYGGQQGQTQFRFTIEATNIAEAFANLDLALEKGRAKAEQNLKAQLVAQDQKIVIAKAN